MQARDDARKFPRVSRAGRTHSEEHGSNGRSGITNNSAGGANLVGGAKRYERNAEEK